LVSGRSWLAEANLVPKPENDLRAMRDNSDETN